MAFKRILREARRRLEEQGRAGTLYRDVLRELYGDRGLPPVDGDPPPADLGRFAWPSSQGVVAMNGHTPKKHDWPLTWITLGLMAFVLACTAAIARLLP